MFRWLAFFGVIVVLDCVCCPLSLAQDDPPEADSASENEEEAAPSSELDSGDTAWMLVSSALVLMMTCPGLALFYGGLVRKKNIISVLMQCVFLVALMSVVWALWGYSFAFGGDSPYYGSFTEHFALNGVIPHVAGGEIVTPLRGTIPTALFMMFQGTFFIITPALICGAFAERMKFSTMSVFSVLWGTFVYCPMCHWVWADDGWLLADGVIDFAGGTVVHITSGFSALVCALVLGKRRGFPTEPMPPHNLSYTCIGTGLLWVGWFGFNAGSALEANTTAVNAFVATHMAAAAGVLGWVLVEWLRDGKPGILGACTGAVAGLGCITPAAGAVTPLSGICMGFVAGACCYMACTKVKNAFGYDDSLDVFGVHGIAGTLGVLLAGVFGTRAVTGGSGTVGLLEGNPGQMVTQFVSVVAGIAISVVVTFVLLKILEFTMELRVSEGDEIRGLDITQHGEQGYIFQ